MSSGTRPASGEVSALWRYPVKSMLGEELRTAVLREHGLVGDRAYALLDRSDGKVATAKNPRKWPNLFAFRSRLIESAARSRPASLHITLPGGRVVYGEQDDVDEVLSAAVGRGVMLAAAEHAPATLKGLHAATSDRGGRGEIDGAFTNGGTRAGARSLTSESYWPAIEGLDGPESLTDFHLRAGTFFDSSAIHLLTTATLDRLHDIYPDGRFDPRRFRPNLVVEAHDGSGFVESTWVGKTLAIGDEVRLAVTADSERCVMTTLAQEDLPIDRGVLRTVVQHNRARVGVYARVVRGGTIRRGDRVEVAADDRH